MAKSVLELAVGTGQWDAGLKKAKSALDNFTQAGGGLQQSLAKDSEKMQQFVRMIGQMESNAKTAKGQMNDYKSAIEQLTMQYNRMTDAQKKTVGQDYLKSIDQLKVKYQSVSAEIQEMNRSLNQVDSGMSGVSVATSDWSGVLNQLGGQLGINTNMLNMVTTGTIATTAAVTAGVAAVAAATKAWADYNDEINRQSTMTTVVTGLKGDASEELTMGARALVRTYDVDFRQAIEAANTLMQQFGVSGEQALSLLQDGMQGMIAGDGGKLLSMIQQYAPSFRDAGIEASQLVAVIQNSEGGLFTDQNMQAIVMGIRNIRLMTKQTSDALAQLGIDGQEMSRKLEDGSMTIFEALRQVSGAIDNVDSGSKAAGEVMQSVFGRQGTMAGTKLGEAIATLNTNLEETKKQTGELGESFVRLNEANLELEQTMQEIFGMSGWEDMNNFLKTELAHTLTFTLEFLINIRDTLKSIGSYAIDTWNDVKTAISEVGTSDGFEALCNVLDNMVIPKLTGVADRLRQIKGLIDGLTGNTPEPPKAQQQTNQQKPVQNGYQVTTDKNGTVVATTRIVNGEKKDVAEQPKQQTNQRTYEQVKADLDRAKKELENAKDSISRGSAKSLVDYYEQELKRLPKPEVKPTTNTKTTTSAITTNKDVWAPIDMKSVDMSKFGILPLETEKQLDAVIAKVKELNGVMLDPHTMEVTVDDVAALAALREIDGVTIDPKTFSITATDEALPKLRDIEGVNIDEKTFSITATDEALPLLKDIEGVKLDDKELKVIISVDDFALNQTIENIRNTHVDFLFGRSKNDVKADISKWQKREDESGDEMGRAAAKAMVEKYQEELKRMNAEGDVTKGGFADAYKYDFGKDIKKLETKPADDLVKSGKATAEAWREAASAIGSVGNALSGLEDPSAKIVGTVGQAIAQIALGFAQASAADSKIGVFGWIAAVAGGLGTMLSTISAIHNATGYANGGVVKYDGGGGVIPGNSFSGDNLRMIGVNSGEIIMNVAQGNNVANALLSRQQGGSVDVQPWVDGERVFLGMNNSLQRKGRGEIVTTSMLKQKGIL